MILWDEAMSLWCNLSLGKEGLVGSFGGLETNDYFLTFTIRTSESGSRAVLVSRGRSFLVKIYGLI